MKARTYVDTTHHRETVRHAVTRNGRGLPTAAARRPYPQSEFRRETRLTHRPPVELAPEPGAGPALTQRSLARSGMHRGHRLPHTARTGPPSGALADGGVGLGAGTPAS